MMETRLSHTADLAVPTLDAIHALLDAAFGGLDDSDWEHALGGMHATVWDHQQLVGHGAVVQRRLLHEGKALRTGYVEGVAVHEKWRRRGVGGAVMAALERVIRGAYDLGALGSSEMALPFYAARGWVRWEGQSWVLTPDGVQRTKDDDGGIYVLPGSAALAPAGDLTCDWRDGDVW
jgi:aminoglycoside 2'-N-acetyltransferase I